MEIALTWKNDDTLLRILMTPVFSCTQAFEKY